MWKKTIGTFLFIGFTLFLYPFSVIADSDFGVLSHLFVKTMSLCHGWGCKQSQTAPPIHLRHFQSVWVHWYAVHWHTVVVLNSYLIRVLGFWVTYGVKMMSLCHGWGWQTPQNDSYIHMRHIHSVWAHQYAVHWHMVAALHSYTHPNWLRFWGFGSLVKSKWCYYAMVDADSHLNLLPIILDIYTVFEHIDILSIGIW